jgi:hypothetical protein
VRQVESIDLDHVQLLAGRPRLEVTLIGDQIELAWPSAHAGLRIEIADDAAGPWIPLNTVVTIRDGASQAIMPAAMPGVSSGWSAPDARDGFHY